MRSKHFTKAYITISLHSVQYIGDSADVDENDDDDDEDNGGPMECNHWGILAGLVQCVTPGHENIRFVVSVDDLFLMFDYCNNMV